MNELTILLTAIAKLMGVVCCGALYAWGGGIQIGDKNYGWKPARAILFPVTFAWTLFLTSGFNWWVWLVAPALWAALTVSYGENAPLTKWFGKYWARYICGLVWSLPFIILCILADNSGKWYLWAFHMAYYPFFSLLAGTGAFNFEAKQEEFLIGSLLVTLPMFIL